MILIPVNAIHPKKCKKGGGWVNIVSATQISIKSAVFHAS